MIRFIFHQLQIQNTRYDEELAATISVDKPKVTILKDKQSVQTISNFPKGKPKVTIPID